MRLLVPPSSSSALLSRAVRSAVAGVPTKVNPMASTSTTSNNRFSALNGAAEEQETASTSGNAAAAQQGKGSQENGSAAAAAPASGRAGGKATKIQDPLVWVDLEMTGLDLERDTIIEIAVIITDGQLKQEIQGPAFAIHHPDEVLDTMNDWCKEHHGKSGLTQRVRESTISMEEAQEQVVAFVKQHIPDSHTAQLAGNSVHVDRTFLSKCMPQLVDHLHYRIVDVSTIKELARRWFPKEYKSAPRKKLAHTALSDIQESIEELKHWRKAIFKQK